MKRRTFSFIALFIFFFGNLFYTNVYAHDFSLTDLSLFGIPASSLSRSTPATCDGRISSGEYGKGSTFDEGEGLFLLTNGSYNDLETNVSSAQQENFALLADDDIYIAFRLRCRSSTLGVIVKNQQSCYRVSVSLGLTPGEHPALRGSFLTNVYYFSSSDLSCVGFTGERKSRSLNEKSSFSKPLSSYVSSYSENGIVAADGTKWNAEQYCKNAAFSLNTEGDISTMIVEVRIPLEDALLSVHTSQRDSVRSIIKNQTKSLCGGITTCVDLNEYSCIVTGLPSDHAATFASQYDTIADWMEHEFEPPFSGVYIPSVVPIPLYLSGKPPKVSNVPSTLKTAPPVSDEPVAEAIPSTTTATNEAVPDPESVSDDLISDPTVNSSENDESIFDSLPESDDFIPEETEIVYDAQSVTTKSQEKKDSLASNILATITGALLFASVMVLCLFFRNSNSEKESDKKKGKKKKKQNRNRE